MKRRKTLSRNEIYSPLEAYEQTQVPPSSYIASLSSLPKSLHESSLVSFLQNSSFEYHRKQAKAEDPKNNGSRPTSIADVEEKIRQRAVTVIGGGVTSSLPSNKGTQQRKRRQKRKRKTWEEMEKILQDQNQTTGENSASKINSIQFLRQMNTFWNQYMSNILHLDGTVMEESKLSAIFVSSRNDIELSGAHVRISQCSQKRSLKGRLGVLIGESSNTWQIAMDQRKEKSFKREQSKSQVEQPLDQSGVDTLIVPKRGSTLSIIIPLPASEAVKSTTTTEKVKDVEELITFPKHYLSIVLDPSKNDQK